MGAEFNKEYNDGVEAQDALRRVETMSELGAILASGASIDAQSALGETALYFACSFLKPTTLALLIERGADVNATSRGGNAALSVALGQLKHAPALDIVAMLLKAGARVVTKACSPIIWLLSDPIESPAFFAARRAALEMLIEAGADFDTPLQPSSDIYGKYRVVGLTPMCVALRDLDNNVPGCLDWNDLKRCRRAVEDVRLSRELLAMASDRDVSAHSRLGLLPRDLLVSYIVPMVGCAAGRLQPSPGSIVVPTLSVSDAAALRASLELASREAHELALRTEKGSHTGEPLLEPRELRCYLAAKHALAIFERINGPQQHKRTAAAITDKYSASKKQA